MRISIGVKIFGTILIVLTIMVIFSAVSIGSLDEVGDRVALLAEYYLSLQGKIARIEASALEQEILIEQILWMNLAGRPEEQVEAALARISSLGRTIDATTIEAAELLQTAIEDRELEADPLLLAELIPRFHAIEREHQHFADTAALVVDLYREGRTRLDVELRARLEAEEEEYRDVVASLRNRLQELTETSVAEAREHEATAFHLSIVLTACASLVGLLLAGAITAGLVKPVKRLVAATRAVESGDLTSEVQVRSRDEIGTLASSFSHMVEELRLKETMRQTFGRYLDPRVVERLLASSAPSETSGERRQMTVFFSDLVGFTHISESLLPDTLVRLLNRHFTLHTQPIHESGGIIDKFIGDAVMAFWGPPFTGEEEHARLAVEAALAQRAQLKRLQQELPEILGMKQNLPELDFRVGIATGEVLVGNIGSERSRSYTVMGDTVNLASRLESVNKHYRTHCLMDEETAEKLPHRIWRRELDLIQVAGREEPVRIFELPDPGRCDEADLRERFREFRRGLQAYREGNWAKAEQSFRRCLELDPEDGPAALLLERSLLLAKDPPGKAWQGVWRFREK